MAIDWRLSMRIIAGQFRGMPLAPPPGDTTRPITDRAKQSLVDALQDCFAAEGGGVVLDCFAGTGSMGLECLSRGAKRAIFIERDRGALRALKENIAALGVAAQAAILPVDAYSLAAGGPSGGAAALAREAGEGGAKLTVAFVDPPYSHTETGHLRHKLDELLRSLARDCMVDGGIISLRHPTRVTVDAEALGVKVVRELRYGEMAITWIAKA
ncbi:MAG TPA: RsmD family RNA methyltransferase [Phycisphaerae bacterium]|nr:RsmD family RNA methyltransferase [Phycisphaerae bacterium]